MIKDIFRKPTKWSVMQKLILKEVDDLIIGSLGIVAFISFFVGGVVAIQTSLNMTNPLIPKNLVGFATRQSIVLEFAPTFISVIMAGMPLMIVELVSNGRYFELPTSFRCWFVCCACSKLSNRSWFCN